MNQDLGKIFPLNATLIPAKISAYIATFCDGLEPIFHGILGPTPDRRQSKTLLTIDERG